MSRKPLWILCVLTLAFLLFGCATAPASQPTASPEPPKATLPPTTESPDLDAATPTMVSEASTATPISPTATAFEAPVENTPTTAPFELFSPAFGMDEPIPEVYTCHGADISPPLAWSDPPAGTQSLVLIMDDPDAVQVVGFVWDHWLLFNLPANARSLPEGIPADKDLPNGSRHGTNTFPRLGYDGPCPPSGQTHKYIFTLYALDTMLNLEAGANKEALLAMMEGHILAEATYSGVYTSP